MAESSQPTFHDLLTAGRELKRVLVETNPGEPQDEFSEAVARMRSLLTADSTSLDMPNSVIEQFGFADRSVKRLLQRVWVLISDTVKLYWDLPSRREAVCLVDELLTPGADAGRSRGVADQGVAGKTTKDKAPDATKKKSVRRPKKTRTRVPRTVTLLLALLDDRRHANLNLSELAKVLGVHVSSVSRAFRHEKYGPQLKKRCAEHGVPPPRIREI